MMKLARNSYKRARPVMDRKAQAIVEFTFAMIIVILMAYATMMVFRWSAIDFVYRRKAHDDRLLTGVDKSYSDRSSGPLRQLHHYFYKEDRLNAVWGDM